MRLGLMTLNPQVNNIRIYIIIYETVGVFSSKKISFKILHNTTFFYFSRIEKMVLKDTLRIANPTKHGTGLYNRMKVYFCSLYFTEKSSPLDYCTGLQLN